MKGHSFTLLLIILFLSKMVYSQDYPYLNPKLSTDERVNDLLNRMTIEEKISQVFTLLDVRRVCDKNSEPDVEKMKIELKYGRGCIGSHELRFDTPNEVARKINAVQRFVQENTRLKIPVIFYGEGLHGFMSLNATVFPQPIALGSSWDTILIEKIFHATATEMRSVGVRQTLSPVIDLGREPRWGRIDETYGEDPYLVGAYAKAAVNGFQGTNRPLDSDRVAATLKHFAVHSQPENGTNLAPGNISERIIRENFFIPFEEAVKEANAMCVMASFNEINCVPSHANPWLLKDVLRNEWNFDGYVIADQTGVEQLFLTHTVAENAAQAGKLAISSGVDMELPNWAGTYHLLDSLIATGELDVKILDNAVKNILRIKFEMGLFENIYVNDKLANSIFDSKEHIALSEEAAGKSMVLLKNEKNTMPFDAAKIKKLAVIGPNAKGMHFGGYAYDPRVGTDVYEGMAEFGKGKFEVVYAEGCKITVEEGGWWDQFNPTLNSEESDLKMIAEAEVVAKDADAIVLVLGSNVLTCREAYWDGHRGDMFSLDLLGRQELLAQKMLALGKPLVVLLINGRPHSINYLAENCDAIIEGWYLGEETGKAVAKVIFGKVNPSGKLSVTIPKSVGHLPVYYNYKPAQDRNFLFSEQNYIYPFGHGLSYSKFEYSNLRLSDSIIDRTGEVVVSVDVKNTSEIPGSEVVQLYIRDKVSSVTRPVKELKGFSKVEIMPGETKKVQFKLNQKHLRLYDINMERVVEPGVFTLMIGSSSQDIKLIKSLTVK